jgi:Protein of unknown function (DUF3109)
VIAIENILVSDSIVEEQFVCDLNACKGGCCEDGDAGAPLEKEELTILKENFEKVKPYLTKDGIEEIEKNGFYVYDREFGWVTPTIGNKMCAYGCRDKSGVIKCGIEQAFNDGMLTWRKPISCHLYPVKIKKSKKENLEYVNYEPREGMCDPGCAFGRKLKVPVYQFLKESLIRKYGEDFYKALDQVARDYFDAGKSTVALQGSVSK